MYITISYLKSTLKFRCVLVTYGDTNVSQQRTKDGLKHEIDQIPEDEWKIEWPFPV